MKFSSKPAVYVANDLQPNMRRGGGKSNFRAVSGWVEPCRCQIPVDV